MLQSKRRCAAPTCAREKAAGMRTTPCAAKAARQSCRSSPVIGAFLCPTGPRFPEEARHRELSVFRLPRSEEHTSELQSLMRISYAVFCLQNKINLKNE